VSDVEILGGASRRRRKSVGPVRGARLRQLVSLHERSLARYLARLGLPSAEVDDAIQEVLIVRRFSSSRRASSIGYGPGASGPFSLPPPFAWRATCAAVRRDATA
jgi:hypothetical protein